jgi:hypothetical protein
MFFWQIILSFAGPHQKTPSDIGDWKIFLNERLIKDRLWPREIFTCVLDSEKDLYTIRCRNFYYMNIDDVINLAELLYVNGFRRSNIDDPGQMFFQPRSNDVPREVKDPNPPQDEFEYVFADYESE